MMLLHTLFWLSFATVAYVYAGYPLLVWAWARRAPARPRGDGTLPTVTLLVAAYNEADILAEKLKNSRALDYPADKLEIAFVLDGSTDDSAERLAEEAGVRVLHHPARAGKNAAIRRTLPMTSGDIIVLSDANAMYRPDALRELVAPFADATVGLTSGAKVVRGAGEGAYWRYENALKAGESRLGSAMGGVGEMLAVRRTAWHPAASDAILEDLHMVLDGLQRGWQHVFVPEAITEEEPSATPQGDLERRARMAAGGWQLLVRFRALLHPRNGWTALALWSHRALRWTAVPVALTIALPLLNALLLWNQPGPLMATLMAGQLAAMSAAVWAQLRAQGDQPAGWARIPHFLYLSNYAALLGAMRYAAGRQAVTWERVARRA